MSGLEVRKINFDLENVEFIWNKDNPEFSLFINHFSFWIIALEKYFCKTINAALPSITDTSLKAEAKLFMQQEVQHSLAHLGHVNALTQKYPELKHTLKKVVHHYDVLFAQRPLNFHLAYMAGEAAFAPIFAMYIHNRKVLFEKGDGRIAALCLWHFIEEIEHRSTGLAIYNHICGNWWFRIKELPSMLNTVKESLSIINNDFKTFVPLQDWRTHFETKASPFSGIPPLSILKCAAEVFMAQLPGHDPAKYVVPEWYNCWLKRYKNNQDMSIYQGNSAP